MPLPRPFLAAAFVVLVFPAARAADVHVILWFDTEDYLLPADDDATWRLASLLTEREIRATFKLVGEKARVLEKRERKDVIAALKKHDIGYHSNYHSVHPAPAEYLAGLGWSDGVAEFVRREGPGAADVRRILGVERLSCYGQPGSSWAPQTSAALPAMGIKPCYVDEGSHIGLEGKPFWYAGALTVYHMSPNYTRMDLHREGGLEDGKRAFQSIHDRLKAAGGGLISIFYHPCEWVHVEFWDGVNFRRGANPPREEWKPPPQRLAKETEVAFRRFEEYIDFQRSMGVRFVTASDLPGLYPDRVRADGLGLASIEKLAGALSESSGVDFATVSEGVLSPADQLVALVEAVGGTIDSGSLPMRVEVASVLGPSEPPPAGAALDLEWPAFRDALLDARDEIRTRKQVPSWVFAGTRRIPTADFLIAVARVAKHAIEAAKTGKPLHSDKVSIPAGVQVLTQKRVAEDTPGLFGGWIIHEEGFRAPRILEQARLQAWTLKPAR
jgi:hypothetical protein